MYCTRVFGKHSLSNALNRVILNVARLPDSLLNKSDVWLTVHRNSVWIRNQLDVTFVLSFISPLQVAQHVSDNHVPIFRS